MLNRSSDHGRNGKISF